MSQLIQSIFNWPGKKLTGFNRHLNALTPFKKCEIMYEIGRFLFNLIGLRILDDCVNNWLTPLSPLIGVEQVSLTLYTAWFYWDENKITAIQPLIVLAFVVPVSQQPNEIQLLTIQIDYCFKTMQMNAYFHLLLQTEFVSLL